MKGASGGAQSNHRIGIDDCGNWTPFYLLLEGQRGLGNIESFIQRKINSKCENESTYQQALYKHLVPVRTFLHAERERESEREKERERERVRLRDTVMENLKLTEQ